MIRLVDGPESGRLFVAHAQIFANNFLATRLQQIPGVGQLLIFKDTRAGILPKSSRAGEEREHSQQMSNGFLPHQEYSSVGIETGTIVGVDCQSC